MKLEKLNLDGKKVSIDVLDKIVERVEGDVIDRIRQVPIQKLFR